MFDCDGAMTWPITDAGRQALMAHEAKRYGFSVEPIAGLAP